MPSYPTDAIGANLASYVYGRLNVHVSLDDAALMDALDRWADRGLKAGRGRLTDADRDAIRRVHNDAWLTYMAVQNGVIGL
jgi:hypothetical protein